MFLKDKFEQIILNLKFKFQSIIDHLITVVEKIDKIEKNIFQICIIGYFCLNLDDFHNMVLSYNTSIDKYFIVNINLYPMFCAYLFILQNKILHYCY